MAVARARTPAAAAALLVAASLLVAAPAAAVEFLDSYKQGLDAVERGDWPEAARLMEGAVAGRPKEAARLMRYGYLRVYLPHYYLGVARAELGDCPGALTAFAESEGQGVIEGRIEYADLIARRKRCQDVLAAAKEAEEAAKAAVERAAAAAVVLGQLATSADLAPLWGQGEPSLAGRQREAERDLAAARDRLAGASGSADFQAAEELAVRTQRRFEELQSDAQRRREQIRESLRAEREELDRLRGDAEQALAAMTGLAPYPPLMAAGRTEVETLVAEAGGLGLAATAAELSDLQERLGRALNRLRAAIAPPPDPLVAAADAFFAGDYSRTLELLAGRRFRDRRAAAHAHLLAAAARFSLAAGAGGDGEEGAVLLAEARLDVAACREADPSLTPPARLFSPRFLTFFQESLGSSETAGD